MAEPIAQDLFEEDPAGVHLIGGRRKSDGRIVFPLPTGSERQNFEPVRLAGEGRLWSFTVQRFRPKSPPYCGADDDRSFKPFALGYVELAGQVIVETRIVIDDPSRLKIGIPMRCVTVEFPRSDGGMALTYAFAPIA